MKAIYDNKIVEVNVFQINGEDNCARAVINDREMVTLSIYTYYKYEEEPLCFMPLPLLDDTKKLNLIRKYEEWYGNTDQNTTYWALEFEIFVRMLLEDHLIINPKYLELNNDLLIELLAIINPGI